MSTYRRRRYRASHPTIPTRRRAGLGPNSHPRGRSWIPFGWSRRKAALVVIGGGFGLFLIVLAVTWVTLPDPTHVSFQKGEVKMYDRGGTKLVADVTGDAIRTPVALSKVSPVLQEATIAAEDRNFYTHHGIDWPRLAKAVTIDLVNRRAEQGASTITQQLAKNDLLAGPTGIADRTLIRKFREAILATRLEGLYPKNQILELYLNSIFYGHHAYGIGAASVVYFNKQPSDLTLGQASFLAGLPQAPTAYDPKNHYADAKARQAYVLDQMVKNSQMLHDTTVQLHSEDSSITVVPVITQEQADAAKAEDLNKQLVYHAEGATGPAPHFVEYVMSQLERLYGATVVATAGLSVTTTLDLDVQAAANKAVHDGVPKLSHFDVNNGAMLVTLEQSGHQGEIVAMVGSADFSNDGIAGQVNITTVPRQPGSSFKPYDYVTGINNHKFDTLTTFHDTADQAKSMDARNPVSDFDNRYMGPMRMRQALDQSRNVPAEEAMQKAGVGDVVDMAHRLGIGTKIQPNLASAIGASEVTMLDHSEGYGVLASQGTRHDPVSILKVQKLNDGGGELPVEHDNGQQVLDQGPAFIINNILLGYNKAWNLGFDRPMAAKSGTTNIESSTGDGWLMAYNPDVVIATWAGHTSNNPNEGNKTRGFYGVTAGQVITAPFLRAMKDRWKDTFTKPSDVKQANCSAQGVQTGDTPPGGEYVLVSDTTPDCTPPSPSPTATPSNSPSPTLPTPPVSETPPVTFSPTPRRSPPPSPPASPPPPSPGASP